MTESLAYRPPDEVCLFILRRAVRYGSATRRDVPDAFGKIGTTKATLALDAAAAHWPRTLERTGKGIRLREGAEIPPEASESQLLECLENGWLAFRHTGLRPRELPAERVQWTHNAPRKAGVLATLTHAIVHEQAVRIAYVGLRKDESARWRLLLPVGLERMGDQWRVVAQDLEAEQYPIKTFVLPRIVDAEATNAKLPDDIIRQAGDDRLVKVPIRLNPELTDDQRTVLAHELNIREGAVSLPKRGVFEFLRRFSDQEPSPDAVWPPIFREEEE